MAELTTSSTGGMKGEKPCQLASVPPAGLRQLGEVCGMGARKYDLHNYRKGYEISKSLNALYRHVLEFQEGVDADEESGLNPLAHAAWHCLNVIQTLQDHPQFDDRYKPDSEIIEVGDFIFREGPVQGTFVIEDTDEATAALRRRFDEYADRAVAEGWGNLTPDGTLQTTTPNRRDLPA